MKGERNERKVKAKKIKEIRSTPPINNIEKKKEKQKINKRTKESTKRKQIIKIETYLECRQTKTPAPKKKAKSPKTIKKKKRNVSKRFFK